jgi:hypothetical protein
MTETITTFEQCKQAVAKKYGLGRTLVTGHLSKYWEEAAKDFTRIKCEEQREYCAENAETNCTDDLGYKMATCVVRSSILNARQPEI